MKGQETDSCPIYYVFCSVSDGAKTTCDKFRSVCDIFYVFYYAIGYAMHGRCEKLRLFEFMRKDTWQN